MINNNWTRFFAFGLLLLAACKDPSITSTGLLTDLDKQKALFTDTLQVISRTVGEDSLRTDRLNSLPTFLIGKMDDPVFGKTYAGLFAQLRLPANNVVLPGSLKLDSVVLSLPYNGYYGDTTDAMSMVVYQLAESMSPTELYYSDKKFATSIELGRRDNYVPHPTDSVAVGDGKMAPHMRIRLYDSFGDNILAQSGSSNFTSNTSFTEYFKGIYITPDTNQGGNSMLYFDLSSILAKCTFYYDDSLEFSLNIDLNSAKSNHFIHNYSGSTVAGAFGGADDSVVYVQSLAGVKSSIQIPEFKNLGRIAVNKAELVFTVRSDATQLDTVYSVPSQMYCLRQNEEGRNDFITDLFQGLSHFGGGKSVTTTTKGIEVTRYKFNLSFHFQQIADGILEDYGLYLVTFPSSQVGDRVIIGGGSHPDEDLRMKLNLTYTKLDQ